MTFVRNTLAAMIAAACGTAALAASASPLATQWAPTKTLAHAVFAKSTGDALSAAEEVAPGEALHVVVTLQLRDRAGLDARIEAIRNGQSATMTGGELAAAHLPTPAQAQAVADYLSAAGFRNIEVAGNRMVVSADGSASIAKSAFNTELHYFGQGADRVIANTKPALVPASLASIVMSVHGLQTAATFHTMSHIDVTRAKAVGHQPTDFPILYNASALPVASTAILGIISEGDLDQTLVDLKSFTTKAGYPTTNATVKYVGTKSTDTSGLPEWSLDSQDSLAAAGGVLKQMIFYAAPSLQDGPLTTDYNQAVTDNIAKVINISLGECETSAKSSGIEASNDQIFALGTAQGQTFSVSSGDSGSYECGKRKGNIQSYPAVSPYVMALGGTTLNTVGTTTYSSETVWVDAGGGPSTTEPVPAYQKSSGVVGGSAFRGVPDIAFDANPSSGAIIIVNGSTAQYGGTSLAAPLFAGFWSRIQSQNGNTLVTPNTAIYKYAAANPTLFHDVTSGNNGGYTASAGWDYASGWGSLNVGNFAAFVGKTAGF